MTRVQFAVTGAEAQTLAASPAIRLHLKASGEDRPVAAIALRARIQIEPPARTYSPEETNVLEALFGSRELGARWTAPLQWHEASTVIGAFETETAFDLVVPCSYDADVTCSRYFTSLSGGAIPIRLFFNGTIFRADPAGFQVEMLPWNLECTAQIPLQTWRDAMDACFPGQTWIRVSRSTYDALQRYRDAHHLRTFDETIARLQPEEIA